jgi:hypothetical protein
VFHEVDADPLALLQRLKARCDRHKHNRGAPLAAGALGVGSSPRRVRGLHPDTLRYDKAMRRLVGEGTVVVARALYNEGFNTLRRSSSSANPPLAKSFRFDLILREGAPHETSF